MAAGGTIRVSDKIDAKWGERMYYLGPTFPRLTECTTRADMIMSLRAASLIEADTLGYCNHD